MKFIIHICSRRETGEKRGEKLRVYQVIPVAVQTFPRTLGKESMTPSQSKPPVAATGMKGARSRNRRHS